MPHLQPYIRLFAFDEHSDRSSGRRAVRDNGEQGIAMALALVCLTLLAVCSVVIFEVASRSRSNVTAAGARSADVVHAQGAVRLIQQAMASREADFGAGDTFTLTRADIARIAVRSGGDVVPNSATAYPDTAMGTDGVAVSGCISTCEAGMTPWWQVVRVVPPNPATAQYTTVLYVRAWHQQGSNRRTATPARVIRAELRPGSFADYQLISDTPVHVDTGTTISGHVHSNGFVDDAAPPPASDASARVWAEPGVSCSGSGGIIPAITTAKGSIMMDPSVCKQHAYTGSFIDLGRVSDALAKVKASCGTGRRVSCFSATSGRFSVVMYGSYALVNNPMGVSTTVALSHELPTTMLFDNDVDVSGTAWGRVTIAAYRPEAASVDYYSQPTINVVGDLESPRPTNRAETIGLIGEGDITIAARPCIARVTAAMATSGGTIGLPASLATPTIVAGAPRCGSIQAQGSWSSHLPMRMRWSWGASGWTGYASRRFSWDPVLRLAPPPFFPATHSWELVRETIADGACLPEITTESGATCP